MRSYFVNGDRAADVAKRFGYTVGSFHQLAHQFRNDPSRRFFVDKPCPGVKADEAVNDKIVALRKQNLSIDDIGRALKNEDIQRTPTGVSKVLKE